MRSPSRLKESRLNLGPRDRQRKKRKRFSPSAQKPPEMKFPGIINSRLLHRQPDSSSLGSIISEGRTSVNPVPGCCSSFGSLHTQNLISFQTFPSTKSDCAEAKTLATADKCVNNDSICTPDQALPKHCRENRTTSSASEAQKNSKSSVTNSCNNLTEDTIQLKDLSTSRVSTTGHDVVSKSDSSVSSQNQSKHPSTSYVCKSIKKLTRYPKSSAATRQRLQCEKSNDPERNKEFQADKSDMMPEISLCVSRVAQRNSDSHETKQGFKEISQTASDSSSQKEMRSEALPQVLFKTPLPKRSATTPAFKRTFKCQESNANLDNLKTLAQTSFQRPGTPRPKSCPESLKWKKAFEQRSTHTRSGAVGMSIYQGQNRSSQLSSLHRPVECSRCDPFLEQSLNLCDDSALSRKFTQRSFHENKSDSNYGIIDRQESTPCMPGPDDRIRQQKPNIPHAHATPEQPSSTSSPELTQAIFSAMSFFMCIPPVESEASFISINCCQIPNTDFSPSGLQTSQTSRQRAHVSGHQHYADNLDPVEP